MMHDASLDYLELWKLWKSKSNVPYKLESFSLNSPLFLALLGINGKFNTCK